MISRLLPTTKNKSASEGQLFALERALRSFESRARNRHGQAPRFALKLNLLHALVECYISLAWVGSPNAITVWYDRIFSGRKQHEISKGSPGGFACISSICSIPY